MPIPEDWPLTNLQYCIARALGREALERRSITVDLEVVRARRFDCATGQITELDPKDFQIVRTVNRNSPEALEEGKGTE